MEPLETVISIWAAWQMKRDFFREFENSRDQSEIRERFARQTQCRRISMCELLQLTVIIKKCQ
jgi:hypothetical protein